MEPTPEQPDDQVDLDLAPMGPRLGARAIDVAIGFLIFFTILVIVVIAYDVELDPESTSDIVLPDGAATILRWVPLVVWGLYEVPLLMMRGQTLGKMVTKIKVISSQGDEPPRRNAALIRWGILAIPPILIPDLLFGLGISFLVGMWFALDSRRQGLHDKAAHTFVVKVAPVDG